MPAVMLTLLSRLATLDVENNPGGRLLAVDPYAGLIANTARRATRAPRAGASAADRSRRPARSTRSRAPRSRGAAAPASRARPVLADARTHRASSRGVEPARRTSIAPPPSARGCRLGAAAATPRSSRAFPLYVVPTYPGDAALFRSPGFRAWLAPDLPLLRTARSKRSCGGSRERAAASAAHRCDRSRRLGGRFPPSTGSTRCRRCWRLSPRRRGRRPSR